MSIFNELKKGLEEAIAFEEGKLNARVKTASVTPVVRYSASDIKKIRQDAGLTQALFAAYMGVSLKTVEAWESGRNTPAGPASRLLALTQANPAFPKLSGIMTR